MAEERVVWFLQAKAYVLRFGYAYTMDIVAKVELADVQGPEATVAQQGAVERNMKAVAFLTLAIPDSIVINDMVAGLATTEWLTQPKADLMVAYLKESYEAPMTLLKVGAKRDLESCVMKTDDHPKGLFEQLIAVQFKYAGNALARISEDEFVTQAVQALPTMYNLTVVGVYETEWRGGQVVTLNALWIAIPLKGKQGKN
jgi:hypothetical protein